MPTQLEEALNTYAHGFSVANQTAANAAPGHWRVQLQAPAGGDGLNVPLPSTSQQLVPASIDLQWVSKNVRFADWNAPTVAPGGVGGGAVLGGMPIADPVPVPGAGTFIGILDPVTEGPLVNPGVPGILGRLAGIVNLPMELTKSTNVPVTAQVQWRIQDISGATITGAAWTIAPATGTGNPPVQAGPDALKSMDLVIPAVIGELTVGAELTVPGTVQAAIQLTAGATSTGWIDLPALVLGLPVVRVPTAAIFWRFADFGGHVLIVVPGNSPLDDVQPLRDALTTLNTLLGQLGDAAAFGAVFVAGLGTLTSGLDNAAGVVFRKADEIANLNDIVLQQNAWYNNDMEAEDEISSLIMVGPPSRRLQAFNARNFSDSEGRFEITMGTSLMVLSSYLHSPNPASNPAGALAVVVSPGTSGWGPWESQRTFGNELSSLRFG